VRNDDADEITQRIQRDDVESAARATAPERAQCMITVLAGPGVGLHAMLDGDHVVVGRDGDCGIRIEDPGLSRRHLRLFRRDRGVYVEDLGSANGTFVDGAPLLSVQRLRDGSRILAGSGTLLRIGLVDGLEADLHRRLHESAVRDPLTALHNRRFLDERLVAEVAYALRHRVPLSFLLLDIDHFKRVNDTYGHLAGDAVIRVVGATLSRMVRTEDLVARWGGEEYAILARGTGGRNAGIFGERIRRAVEQVEIPWRGTTLRVTVSVGAAFFENRGGTGERIAPNALVGVADAALYASKEGGRNRVTVHEVP
jgi:diguanylate cyclase (GGDEF)-like protein